MPSTSDTPLSPDMHDDIQACVEDAASWLGMSLKATAEELVQAVDEAVHGWQQGNRQPAVDLEDATFTFGSLWGEQFVRQLDWQWTMVRFDDPEDSQAVAIVNPDRSLVIYPFHFIFGCIENQAPVTIMLAFQLLVDGIRVPPLPAHGYENVMDHVHHIVPRDDP